MEELNRLLRKQHTEQLMRIQYIGQRLRWGWLLPRWMLRGRR